MIANCRYLGLLAVLAALLAATISAQGPKGRKAPPPKTVLYAAVGPELTLYDFDPSSATLTRRSAVTVPAAIQEGWPHPSGKYLYIAWSDAGASVSPAGGLVMKGQHDGLGAFRMDPHSGALTPDGAPQALPARPIFITTDMDGTHVLTAYNAPSGLTVNRILPDGSVGPGIEQPAGLDFGIYGHQVRMDPSNKTVILMTRGNGPTRTRPEDPGALKIFSYKNGVLANLLSVAPGGGFGFQVRHLDFHPSGKWVFATLERQNQIHVYARTPDGTLGATPLFVKDTVPEADKSRPGQQVASIHVHPDGRFLYVANRAGGTVEVDGKRVFAGGENSIAVFSIDPKTGEPSLIQSIDTRGFQPRTFTLDASGKFLVVANQSSQAVRGDNGIATVPASLALFRIGHDGKLEFVRKYDVETSAGRSLIWARFVSLP